MKIFMVYITAKNRDEALLIGRALVKERLCACANVIEDGSSIFRWEGKVQEGSEALIIAKTREELVAPVMARVKELHSYECPCVTAWPIDRGNEEYLEWVDRTLDMNTKK